MSILRKLFRKTHAQMVELVDVRKCEFANANDTLKPYSRERAFAESEATFEWGARRQA